MPTSHRPFPWLFVASLPMLLFLALPILALLLRVHFPSIGEHLLDGRQGRVDLGQVRRKTNTSITRLYRLIHDYTFCSAICLRRIICNAMATRVCFDTQSH